MRFNSLFTKLERKLKKRGDIIEQAAVSAAGAEKEATPLGKKLDESSFRSATEAEQCSACGLSFVLALMFFFFFRLSEICQSWLVQSSSAPLISSFPFFPSFQSISPFELILIEPSKRPSLPEK